MNAHMTTNLEEWKEEFDKEFKVFFDNAGRPTATSYSGWCSDDIKSFISSLLATQKKEILDDIKGILEEKHVGDDWKIAEFESLVNILSDDKN